MNAVYSQENKLSLVSKVIVPPEKPSMTLTPKQIETSFNFDLDRMTKAINAQSRTVPTTLNNFDEFEAWLNQL
jgi:hypothetical protein